MLTKVRKFKHIKCTIKTGEGIIRGEKEITSTMNSEWLQKW